MITSGHRRDLVSMQLEQRQDNESCHNTIIGLRLQKVGCQGLVRKGRLVILMSMLIDSAAETASEAYQLR